MKSQSDIAKENQDGIKKVNEKLEKNPEALENDRATQYDGNGEPGDAGGTFKPQDDTPFKLEKREQPKK